MKKPRKAPRRPGTRNFRVLRGEMPAAPGGAPDESPSMFGLGITPAQREHALLVNAFENRRMWRNALFLNLATDPVMLVTEAAEVKKLISKAWKMSGDFADFITRQNGAERVEEHKRLAPLRIKIEKEMRENGLVDT